MLFFKEELYQVNIISCFDSLCVVLLAYVWMSKPDKNQNLNTFSLLSVIFEK